MNETSCIASDRAWRSLALVLMFLIASAAAEDSDIGNVAACNGKADVSPDLRIEGCTALTKSADNPKVLAIIYNNRGNAYVAKGQYDLAIADYGEALKDDPQYARAFNNRGVAYQKKAEYDLAIQDFDAALKLNPNYANAIANRAETYRKKGDYVSAAKDLDDAIRLQPNLAVLWNERCWTRAVVGDLPAALSDCNAAIQLTTTDASPFDSRGLTYLKMGQWDWRSPTITRR